MNVHLKRRDFILGLVALITLALNILWPYQSQFVEFWYSRGLFSVYRYVWDYTFGFLPFAAIYLLILLVLFVLLRPFLRKRSPLTQMKKVLGNLARILITAYILFYWLWGFNYKRENLRNIKELSSDRPPDHFVYDEYCRVLDSLYEIRNQITIMNDDDWYVAESSLAHSLRSSLHAIDLPIPGYVRARRIVPKGVLLRFSTAGIYLPFVGEGHIDAGLHPITHPFTMIHEMSHGYGWTGEDACNFLALLTTVNDSSILVRYSGYFGYWRYLRSQLIRIDRDRFVEYYKFLDGDVLEDYKDILAYNERYPDLMPKMRDVIYDSYLKSHGIASGLVNYSEMILLSYQWQQKFGSLSL